MYRMGNSRSTIFPDGKRRADGAKKGESPSLRTVFSEEKAPRGDTMKLSSGDDNSDDGMIFLLGVAGDLCTTGVTAKTSSISEFSGLIVATIYTEATSMQRKCRENNYKKLTRGLR